MHLSKEVKLAASGSPRDMRKKMLSSLEDQQQKEAMFAKRAREAILAGNAQILSSLAELLEKVSNPDSRSPEDVRLITSMCPSFDLPKWSTICTERSEIDRELSAVRSEQAQASRAYDKHSPYGFFSRLAQDDAETRRSLDLKLRVDHLDAHCLRIESRMAITMRIFEEIAESFFRAAIQSSAIKTICASKIRTADDVKKAVNDLSERLNQIWTESQAYQERSLGKMRLILESLEMHYRIDVMKGSSVANNG